MSSKTLIVAHLNDLSGANLALLEFLNVLQQQHMISSLIVAVPRKGPMLTELRRLGVKTVVFHYGTCAAMAGESKLKELIKRSLTFVSGYFLYLFVSMNQIRLVHYNSSVVNVGIRLLQKHRIPYTVHVRELAESTFNMHFYNKPFFVETLSNANQLIWVSETVQSEINDQLQLRLQGVVVYDGIPKRMAKVSRGYLNPKIMLVGAIAPDKGQIEAIRAILMIKARIPNVHLRIIGKIIDSRYAASLLEFVETHHLERNIEFAGFSANVAEERTKFDYAFVCSKNEAYGRVTVEALQAGQVVIGANTGGTAEIIQDGEDGILYKQGSAESLAHAFLGIFGNKILCKKIVHSAVQDVNYRFDLDTSVYQIFKILEKVR